MKILLILLFMSPLSLFAQSKGYADISLLAGTGKELKQSGIGGTFALGFKPSPHTSLGAGIDAIKFNGFKTISPAIYADARGYLGKKSIPFFTLQAGKILYNQTSGRINTSGGLFLAGGLGVSVPTKTKVKPFGMMKYSGYNFNTGKVSNNYGFVSVNIGLEF